MYPIIHVLLYLYVSRSVPGLEPEKVMALFFQRMKVGVSEGSSKGGCVFGGRPKQMRPQVSGIHQCVHHLQAEVLSVEFVLKKNARFFTITSTKCQLNLSANQMTTD